MCLSFKDPFELWLFGGDVLKKGVVSSIPEFACDGSTSISTMLKELYTWMSSNSNKFVYILTDGEDKYDEAYFTNCFNQISSRNHHVIVYDICGTNVQPLKNIFAKSDVEAVTSYSDINSLVQRLQQVMANDRDLIQGVTNVSTSVQSLINNYNELERTSQQLKTITDRLKNQSQSVISSADQAVKDKKVQDLQGAATMLKNHINELADHVQNLKKNERKADLLKGDAADIQDEIDNFETKIRAEKNSLNANQQKIAGYTTSVEESKRKRQETLAKAEALQAKSAAAVTDFITLQKKTEATRLKVTDTLKNI